MFDVLSITPAICRHSQACIRIILHRSCGIRGRPGTRLGALGHADAPKFLEGKKTDPGVTNIRNPSSPHWRRWLNVESRCLIPITSFAEPDNGTFGGRAPVWFALDELRPLTCFAGLWTRWTSVRKVREGETTNDLYAFLTINPNAEVSAIHPKRCLSFCERRRKWISG